MTRSAQLGHRTWPELDGAGAIVLVPIGATEQHGEHLPLSTDTQVAQAVADAVAADAPLDSLFVAPSINYGASGEHEGFPGTVSIGAEALKLMLIEYGRSVCRWATRVVFVNGHGGNVPTLIEAVGRLRYEGRDVAWFPCAPARCDAHAGRTETSLLMAISPTLVVTERARPGNSTPIAELMKDIVEQGVSGVSPNGVLGDPAGANEAEGRSLVAAMSAALNRRVIAWRVDDRGMLG
ncbi:mycofactocin biosynthesis peptidyl-dipeptidase MftE [Gordonia sp. TBRC 11910]|uniref:Mycofactocin biosynthesis peptidyl-dipeptidase MftE n=1 Tax=Gordonia asplenii TaxID=2725283 RepID=A0A848KTD7_9ACTN|nr:mycofactocin biosynthesis peptidyl-dipeptidase MftE [Gordonia asplenii]NMO02204.1 mycofactocin biosynthesis peptidyl-dipeptidase MftE [Gordonia asplenii]